MEEVPPTNNNDGYPEYKGVPINISLNREGLVNATIVAKSFPNKPTYEWLRQKQAKEFIEAYSSDVGIPTAKLIRVKNGGRGVNDSGTWMHRDILIQYLQWVSPHFAIWVSKHINRLLDQGSTAIQDPFDDDPAIQIAKALQTAAGLLMKRDIEIRKLSRKSQEQDKIIGQMSVDVEKLKRIENSPSGFTTTDIAKSVGVSAQRFNRWLKSMGIMYKCSDRWVPYAKYQRYAQYYWAVRTNVLDDGSTKHLTVWTEKGRIWILEIWHDDHTIELGFED